MVQSFMVDRSQWRIASHIATYITELARIELTDVLVREILLIKVYSYYMG